MRYPYTVDRKLLDQIASPDYFIFTIDLDAHITFCNDAFQRLYQIVGESVEGASIDSLLHSKDAIAIKDAVHQALLTKSLVPSIVKLSSPGIASANQDLHYEISPVHDRRSYPIAFLLIGKMVTALSNQKATTSMGATSNGLSGQNRE